MIIKELLGFLAVGIAFGDYAIYGLSVLKRDTKPHVFTWLIWGISEAIAAAAQFSKHAGAGAWVTGFSAAANFAIAALALRWGEKNITRGDWLAFVGALTAIPLWYFTKDPLGAVILVTIIDTSAYYPTFRKSWLKPREELAFAYILGSAKYFVGLLALESYMTVTVLYPLSIFVVNSVFITMLIGRRVVLAKLTK